MDDNLEKKSPGSNDAGRQQGKHLPETLSQQGAIRLARRLEHYWHEKGYPTARFWPELIEERFAKVGTYDLYRVACNLVNGLPPEYR